MRALSSYPPRPFRKIEHLFVILKRINVRFKMIFAKITTRLYGNFGSKATFRKDANDVAVFLENPDNCASMEETPRESKGAL